MGYVILQILTPSAIVGFVLFLARNLILTRLKNAVKHEYDVKLKEYESDLKILTETELAKLNSHLTMELEIAKLKIGPYSQKQFELYNQLWINLIDLKYSMLELWGQASEDRFTEFSRSLDETTIRLEKSALIIEEQHYRDLINILNEFSRYQFGKRSLIDYKKEQPIASYDHDYVQLMIAENKASKDRLLNYLPQIRNCLRNQISGCNAERDATPDQKQRALPPVSTMLSPN
jgi:hypothetical protein